MMPNRERGKTMKRIKRVRRLIADELGSILLLVVLLFLPGWTLFHIVFRHASPDPVVLVFSIGLLYIDALLVREFINNSRCYLATASEVVTAPDYDQAQ
jgi:hypothetical protein